MNRELLDVFGLDPEILHLNHGAFGCAPIPVRREAERWRDRAERNPHQFNGHQLPGLIAQARQRAAVFLDTDPAAVGLVRNVSEGVSSVLGSLDLVAGDEIVVCNHGYGAVTMAARNRVERRGGVIRTASFGLDADDEQIVRAYADECGPRTRLVIVDQITSPTAMVLPVAQIAAAVEAPVLADAAHVPGTLPVDIAGLGVDHWVGNLHKWCYTPRGTALLWTRDDLRDSTFPATMNWQLNDGYAASFDYPGTWDYAGWLALPAGLDFWTELGGWEQIERQSTLLSEAQLRLAGRFECSLDGLPLNPAATMRLIPLPLGIAPSAEAARDLSGTLSDEYGIQAPVNFYHDDAYLRVAAAPYNTSDDYDRLADAVLEIAGR
ncbi:MAG TPA: aminotransferase class V-fold PLP-dependent enzyme [Microlunatus sp.]